MHHDLRAQYDLLQTQYGALGYHSVYACGCEDRPALALVFMNPTARNLATAVDWTGGRYQWIGVKPIWQFLCDCGLFSPELNARIQAMTPRDWTPAFAETINAELVHRKIYMTNLAKCTQVDARPLPDRVFRAYRDLLLAELDAVQPQTVILFGNQVASVTLAQPVSVNTARRVAYPLRTPAHELTAYVVHYPVGNGTANAPKARADILWLTR